MSGKKPVHHDKFIKVSRRVADRLFTKFEIALAEALLQVKGDHLGALHMLGNALTREVRHLEALQVDLQITRLTPRDAYAFYNLACSHSNLAQVDESLAALAQAIKLGYRDFSHLLTDRDLECVRRDSRFKRLLDRKWGKRQP